MKYLNPNIYDNKHSGSSGFVIGGGVTVSSITDQQLISLKSSITVGVNKAYELFVPDYLVFNDTHFWEEYHGTVQSLNTVVITSEERAKTSSKIPMVSDNLYVLQSDKQYKRSGAELTDTFSKPVSFWNNSGATAIRVAGILGLNPIYLLGFDLKSTEGKFHFHDGYPNRKVGNKNSDYDAFYEAFVDIFKGFKARGIQVVSCSAVSMLNKIIPYRPLEQIYGV